MPHVGSPGVHERLKRFDLRLGAIIAAGAYALVGGALTLLGWTLPSPRLTDWVNSGISMFPNSALCAMFSGVALLSLSSNRAGQLRRNTIRILALFVAIIGARFPCWELLGRWAVRILPDVDRGASKGGVVHRGCWPRMNDSRRRAT